MKNQTSTSFTMLCEIIATTGRSPSEHHRDLVGRYGESWYARVDAPATLEAICFQTRDVLDARTAVERAPHGLPFGIEADVFVM